MAESRPFQSTTVRFSQPFYRRLEDAAEHFGLTINALVIAACVEWLDRHEARFPTMPYASMQLAPTPPFWRRMPGLRRRSGQRFDRLFTLAAKNSLALAQEEAEAAGAPISSTFLLLGLALEEGGIAGQALAAAGIDVERLRAARPARASEGQVGAPLPEVKEVLELAVGKAQELGDGHVRTGHLLLALMETGSFMPADDQVRQEVLGLLSSEEGRAKG